MTGNRGLKKLAQLCESDANSVQEIGCKSYDLMLHCSILASSNQSDSKIISKFSIHQAICDMFNQVEFQLLADRLCLQSTNLAQGPLVPSKPPGYEGAIMQTCMRFWINE
jgi:hypothetical protein